VLQPSTLRLSELSELSEIPKIDSHQSENVYLNHSDACPTFQSHQCHAFKKNALMAKESLIVQSAVVRHALKTNAHMAKERLSA
jgi:hypothetical protein